MDIKIDKDDKSFHYRVRGIVRNDDKFLIMRANDANYFYLPGGHVAFGETGEQAIIREILEELGIEISVEKLVCLNEHFYEKKDKKSFHEIVLYFVVKPNDKNTLENVKFVESNKVELKWVTAKEMKELNVKPTVIKSLIINNKLDSFNHF